MSRRGRALGAGRLIKEQRGAGTPHYLLDYRDANGVRRRQMLSTDKVVAERMRAKIIRSRDLTLAGMAGEDGLDLQLEALTSPYLSDLATTSSRRHVAMVGARLQRIFTDTRAECVRDVTPMSLIRLRGEQLKAGSSVRTVNLYATTVRAMFAWAVRAGLLGANPLVNFQTLPEREATKRCKRRALTEEEIARFLDAAREDDENCALLGPRVPQTPLFRLLVECGPRYGEAVSATWADLDPERRILCLRAETTKAGRERQIPLRADLVAEILRLRETHALVLRRPTTPRDRIFLSPTGSVWAWNTVNLMRIYVRVLEAAGVDRKDQTGRKVDLHALRHTAATRLARNGVPLAVTQRILGHSDPKLTARVYQHLEVDDLRSAVEGLDVHNTSQTSAESA